VFAIYLFILFIYSCINPHQQSENKNISVHISAVWTKWPTQGQATYVPP